MYKKETDSEPEVEESQCTSEDGFIKEKERKTKRAKTTSTLMKK